MVVKAEKARADLASAKARILNMEILTESLVLQVKNGIMEMANGHQHYLHSLNMPEVDVLIIPMVVI